MPTLTPSNGIHPEHLAHLKTLLTRYGPELTLRALAAVCDDYMTRIAPTDVKFAKLWLRISTELEAIADSIERRES